MIPVGGRHQPERPPTIAPQREGDRVAGHLEPGDTRGERGDPSGEADRRGERRRLDAKRAELPCQRAVEGPAELVGLEASRSAPVLADAPDLERLEPRNLGGVEPRAARRLAEMDPEGGDR